jgi:hypothetical protein
MGRTRLYGVDAQWQPAQLRRLSDADGGTFVPGRKRPHDPRCQAHYDDIPPHYDDVTSDYFSSGSDDDVTSDYFGSDDDVTPDYFGSDDDVTPDYFGSDDDVTSQCDAVAHRYP